MENSKKDLGRGKKYEWVCTKGKIPLFDYLFGFNGILTSLSWLLITRLAISFAFDISRICFNYFDDTALYFVHSLNILVLIILSTRLSRVTRLTCMSCNTAWTIVLRQNSGQPAAKYESAIVHTRYLHTRTLILPTNYFIKC